MDELIIEINKLDEQQMYDIFRNIATGGEAARNALKSCIEYEKRKLKKSHHNRYNIDRIFRGVSEN